MREVDTETPVVWPAWCYSANTQDSGIDVISRKEELTTEEVLPKTAASPSSFIQTSTTAIPVTTVTSVGSGSISASSSASVTSNKIRAKRKTPYTTPLTTSTGINSSQTFNNSVVAIAAAVAAAANVAAVSSSSPTNDNKSEKFQLNQQQQQRQHQHQNQQQQLSSFLLNKSLSSVEKMLSEHMLMGYSAVDNNKKHCDNTTSLLYDKIKNETQMDSIKNGDLNSSNNNNNNSRTSNNNNNISNSSNSNSSSNNNNNNNNSIKRERLSPSANGDVQSSISRSRSATPSSFPGTPPQPVHPNDMVGQNFTSSLLSSVQSRGSEYQTRNYSDFMRSLAAKYNNNNSNDVAAAAVQRSLFFDQKFPNSGKLGNKESPSPPDGKRQPMQNLTPPQVPNVPFASALLSGLPFPPAVFPPLIDMSSTQALVTLARAAKDAEIQNILRTAQKRPTTASKLSPSMRRTLTPTPQQTAAAAAAAAAAQFASQPFIIPSQFQQQPTAHQSTSCHLKSPVNQSGPASESTVNISPLDLSSTPQTKRMKIEESLSRSNSPSGTESLEGQTTFLKNEIGTTTSNTPTSGTIGSTTTGSTTILTRQCQAQSDEINSWSVDAVCEFVGGIDICAEYAQNFRDQCIDGSGLPLLTEDHLTNSLGMKLGPALKLRSILAKKLGGPCPCVSCLVIQHQQHAHVVTTNISGTTTSIPSTSSISPSSSLSGIGNNNSNSVNNIITANNSHTSNNNNNNNSNIPLTGNTDLGS